MIKIVHTNDIHGRIDGFKTLFNKVSGLRESCPTLLLDAGDALHGLPNINKSRGLDIVDLMNQVGYDAMVPGNHDFNYGVARLRSLAEHANFPIISANVYDSLDNLIFQPYTIKDIDGIRVGIFGLSTPETVLKTSPKSIEGLKFKNPLQTAKSMVKILRDTECVDLVVALTHLGLDDSTEYSFKSSSLAREVSGIDIIVDGHSHTKLYQGFSCFKSLIVQAGEHMEHMGIVSLDQSDKGGMTFSSKLATLSSNQYLSLGCSKLEEIIYRIRNSDIHLSSDIIGKSSYKLEGDRDSVRSRETNLGRLIADSFKHKANSDIAITNGGGIRNSIEFGAISSKDIMTAIPFDNEIVTQYISGYDLIDLLENALSYCPDSYSGFPHISGFQFDFDMSQKVGRRISNLSIKNSKLNLNHHYKLATNDFLACGGDSYQTLKDIALDRSWGSVSESVISYAKSIKDLDYLHTFNRINILESKSSSNIV